MSIKWPDFRQAKKSPAKRRGEDTRYGGVSVVGLRPEWNVQEPIESVAAINNGATAITNNGKICFNFFISATPLNISLGFTRQMHKGINPINTVLDKQSTSTDKSLFLKTKEAKSSLA